MTTLEQLKEQQKQLIENAERYKKQEWELKVMKAHNAKQMKLTDTLIATLEQADIDSKRPTDNQK